MTYLVSIALVLFLISIAGRFVHRVRIKRTMSDKSLDWTQFHAEVEYLVNQLEETLVQIKAKKLNVAKENEESGQFTYSESQGVRRNIRYLPTMELRFYIGPELRTSGRTTRDGREEVFTINNIEDWLFAQHTIGQEVRKAHEEIQEEMDKTA